MTSKLKSRLPGTSGNVQDIDAFITGADLRTSTETSPKRNTVYPWEEEGVRKDVKKPFNLRFSEPYLIKLKFIAENTPNSMQMFCLNAVQDAIDNKIKELTK
jgi:hypothetical protein